jgi:transposase
MEKAVERGLDWAGLPVIATVARLLCRELTLQNEYLRLENRMLKERIPGRIRFTDEERRSLVEAALAMGRSLMKEVVSIVKPETILAWQRRLEQKKWDYSERRRRGPGRPRTPDHIEALVCRLARENRSVPELIRACGMSSYLLALRRISRGLTSGRLCGILPACSGT